MPHQPGPRRPKYRPPIADNGVQNPLMSVISLVAHGLFRNSVHFDAVVQARYIANDYYMGHHWGGPNLPVTVWPSIPAQTYRVGPGRTLGSGSAMAAGSLKCISVLEAPLTRGPALNSTLRSSTLTRRLSATISRPPSHGPNRTCSIAPIGFETIMDWFGILVIHLLSDAVGVKVRPHYRFDSNPEDMPVNGLTEVARFA